jgi:hypothetical protein
LRRALWGNFALGAVILAFFALGAARRLRETLSEYRAAYLYVTPAMLGMLVLVFFPFLYGITLSFTACSAKKALMAKGAPPPVCTVDDNLGVFAVIGVGVLNAGYRVTHNSVITTLKILSEKREGGARRYNPNMQVTASTRKGVDAEK